MEIDPDDPVNPVKKTYMYADSQIIAQRNGGQTAAEYFYVTDRLGSVRQVIDNTGAVVANYTYSPFGQMLEEGGSFNNSFLFTGQWFDSEFSQYYLRARQYDPVLGRFTARDPVSGKFEQPLSLHKYLYCENDPVNFFDPNGESSRSADIGYQQFTFEQYMDLWNTKHDPVENENALIILWSLLSILERLLLLRAQRMRFFRRQLDL